MLVIDAFAGLSGDMMVAALLDLGGDLASLERALRALPLRGWALRRGVVSRGAFAAARFEVLAVGEPGLAAPAEDTGDRAHDHGHDHDHDHGHDHAHGHDHGHTQDAGAPDGAIAPELGPLAGILAEAEPAFPGQPHRPWRVIRRLLEEAPLPPRARDRALAAFTKLAASEARVHGSLPDEVVFHEVGGVDAIIDVVSVALLLEQLGVDELVGGPLPMGRGLKRSAHGTMPLPPPATLFCLEGWPLCAGVDGMEQVTPTGAAILAGMASPGPIPHLRLIGVGHGAGRADPPSHPNMLRLLLGEREDAGSLEQVDVLVATMDDLSGEHLPTLLEALLAAGALDAAATPCLMKKGRSGHRVEVVVAPAQRPAVERALLRHGSTFGLRRQRADRALLRRMQRRVQTEFGEIGVKEGYLDGELLQVAPEFEEVAARARAAGAPAPVVHRAALAAHAAGRWAP